MAIGSRGGKTRVYLLPGMLSTTAEDWEPHLETIKDAGFEPVRIDWPGHGTDTAIPESISLQSLVDHVLAKIDAVTEEPVLIWGYSLGGYVALELERQSPSRCWAIWMHATKFLWNDDEIEAFRHNYNLETISIRQQEILRAIHGEKWRELTQNSMELFEEIVEFGLSLDDLDEIRMPVLVSVGDQDELVSIAEVEILADELILGEPAIVPGVRHSLRNTRSSLIIPIAEEFSRRVFTG